MPAPTTAIRGEAETSAMNMRSESNTGASMVCNNKCFESCCQ